MMKSSKDILWTVAGQLSKVIFQSGFILLLAIVLSPDLYGKYTIVVALINIMGPFIGLGFNQLLVELNVKKEYTANQLYSTGFWLVLSTSLFLTIVGMFIILSIYGLDKEIILLFLFLSLADFFALKFTELNSQSAISNLKFEKAAKIQSLISFSRFSAVAITFVLIQMKNENYLIVWLSLYVTFSILTSLLSIKISDKSILVIRLSNVRLNLNVMKRGIYYSIGLSSQGVYNDVDKIILSKNKNVSTSELGNYGLAYKMMDVIFVPLKSILIKNFPLIIEKGSLKDWDFFYKYLKKILVISYIYILVVLVFLVFMGEKLILFIFSDQYTFTYTYLMYIAPLLFVRMTNYLIADIITGLGFQKKRSLVQVFVAIMNLIFSIILINILNIAGAVIASYISEFIMLIFLILIILKIRKGERL